MYDHMEEHLKAARGVLKETRDQLELCVLVTHCFEDHYEAEGHIQRANNMEAYARNLLEQSTQDVLEEGLCII